MKRFHKILMLSMGHLASDFYPGMLAPFLALPFFTERPGWTNARAATLFMVMNLTANAMQPFLGVLSDRHPRRFLIWMGPLLSAVPFVIAGYMDNLILIGVLLGISGLGVALFHPVAATAAGQIAPENRRGLSMALFSSGGSLGVTLGPLAIVLIFEILDRRFMALAALPAVIMAAYFMMDKSIRAHESHGLSLIEMFRSIAGQRVELFMLWLVSSFRAIVMNLVHLFLVPLAMERGASFAASASFLSVILFASMVGMFLGGHLSDGHGRRRIMAVTMLSATPLLFGFLYTTGFISSVLIFLGMVALTSTIPVNLVLAQQAAPRLSGMASSLVMGVSFMMGAITAPPFGMLADHIGIASAMNFLFVLPFIGGLLVWFIKQG